MSSFTTFSPDDNIFDYESDQEYIPTSPSSPKSHQVSSPFSFQYSAASPPLCDNSHAAPGDNSLAAPGDNSHATSSDNSHAASGDNSHAASGDNSHAADGDNSHAADDDNSHAADGDNSHAVDGDNSHADGGDNLCPADGDNAMDDDGTSVLTPPPSPPITLTTAARAPKRLAGSDAECQAGATPKKVATAYGAPECVDLEPPPGVLSECSVVVPECSVTATTNFSAAAVPESPVPGRNEKNCDLVSSFVAPSSPSQSPPPAFVLPTVRLTNEIDKIQSNMSEDVEKGEKRFYTGSVAYNGGPFIFYSDGSGDLYYTMAGGASPDSSSSDTDSDVSMNSWISGAIESDRWDEDYIDVESENETESEAESDISECGPVDNMKSRMRSSFKILNKIYGNFGMLLDNLKAGKKDLTAIQLCRGEYLAIDLKADMIEKCRAKMVESINQLKDISMQDIMGIVYTGERLCDMEAVRNHLMVEHKNLEKWSKDRLQELQQRIEFFNENIGTLVKVKVVLKNGGETVHNSKFPIWRLVGDIDEDSMDSGTTPKPCRMSSKMSSVK